MRGQRFQETKSNNAVRKSYNYPETPTIKKSGDLTGMPLLPLWYTEPQADITS
jgi:hypothetical protein